MSVWSFYDEATGAIAARTFSGSARLLALNTPKGHRAIAGTYDRLQQRVDVETGEVVARQRPTEEVTAERRAAAAETARLRIEELERTSWRPLRELAIDSSNATAKQRLSEIDSEIAALRDDLLPARGQGERL